MDVNSSRRAAEELTEIMEDCRRYQHLCQFDPAIFEAATATVAARAIGVQ